MPSALKGSQMPARIGLKRAEKTCQCFDQTHWSSSGGRIETGQDTSSLYLNSSTSSVLIRARFISRCYWKLRVGAVVPGFLFSYYRHPALYVIVVTLQCSQSTCQPCCRWWYAKNCVTPTSSLASIPTCLSIVGKTGKQCGTL